MEQCYTSSLKGKRMCPYGFHQHGSRGKFWQKAIGYGLLAICWLALGVVDATASPMPPPDDCNNPIAGKGVVVDLFTGGLAGLLSTSPAYANVVDGDLNNFAEIGLTNVTGVGVISLISVKDQNQVYPAGRRTGFVLEIVNSLGGLLGADVLNSLQIRTYLHNQLQETASVGGGGPAISLNLLSGAGKKRRLDFVTTEPFDEVELVFTGVVSSSLLSSFRIFYAYEEVDGCNYDCAIAINTTNFPGSTAVTCSTILCPEFSNVGNVVDADTTNFASRTSLLLESPFVEVRANTTLPAGVEVGFVVSQQSLLGLLSADLLSNVVVTTRNNAGTIIETFNAGTSLANVGLLGSSGLTSISFPTTQPFTRVRITYNITLSLLSTNRVHYAFVRYDDDQDGFANCVDKCPGGDDSLDADGNGIPNACDGPFCDLDGGLDVSACPELGTANLPAAEVGQTWSVAAGNPSPATINNNGEVSGLANEGIYLFVLSAGSCTDTVAVNYFTALGNTACNDPIAGNGAIVDNNPGCELCNAPNVGNVVDGDLANFVSYGNLLNLSLLGGQTPLISVKDTLLTYPAGTRVGYAVSFPGGLLSLGLLDGFVLRTYLNDVLVETATTSGNLLQADALGSGSGIQRLFFEATQPFDEVELRVAGGLVTLDLLTNINIYYAFTEDAATCPGGSNGGASGEDCSVQLLTNAELCGMLSYERSGIEGLACVGCVVDSLSHILDADLENYATIALTAAALGDIHISVFTPKVIPAGSEAGFGLAIEPSLLSLGVLNNFDLTTYLDGVQQESVATSNPLVALSLLGGGAEVSLAGFVTSLPFDEIQLTIDATVAGASVGGGVIRVYYAYFLEDSDGDGTPDCRDKCCAGADNLDADGDGIPDACESAPLQISPRVYLQGALFGVDLMASPLLMQDSLRVHGRIPLQEPYTALASFQHVNGGGGEMIADSATVLANLGANAIVDWVFVELRSPAPTYTVLATRAALLQRDGDVVDTDGVSPVTFGALSPGDYSVSIRHRNHLGAASELSFALSAVATVVDLADTTTALWDDGSNLDGLEQVTLGAHYALWAGNVNVNTQVVFAGQSPDPAALFNQVDSAPGNFIRSQSFILVGYHTGDVNLERRAIFSGQNKDTDFVFNNVDQHPRNLLRSQTFVIREQLPNIP